MGIDYNNIPDHMMLAIKDYVATGRRLGHFLTAVMSNDLYGAVARADEESLRILLTYVSYVRWETPSECNGSPEKVKSWIEKKSNAGEG